MLVWKSGVVQVVVIVMFRGTEEGRSIEDGFVSLDREPLDPPGMFLPTTELHPVSKTDNSHSSMVQTKFWNLEAPHPSWWSCQLVWSGILQQHEIHKKTKDGLGGGGKSRSQIDLELLHTSERALDIFCSFWTGSQPNILSDREGIAEPLYKVNNIVPRCASTSQDCRIAPVDCQVTHFWYGWIPSSRNRQSSVICRHTYEQHMCTHSKTLLSASSGKAHRIPIPN